MGDDGKLVTVFRSADSSAEEDAARVCARLEECGLHPQLCDEKSPGVVQGSFEVRVPAGEQDRAEDVIARPREAVPGDASHGMDLVTVFRSESATTAEMEALGVRAILQASGIDAVIVGTPVLPVLSFEVCVPKAQEEAALIAIAEAQAAGPAAAEEAASAAEDAQNAG